MVLSIIGNMIEIMLLEFLAESKSEVCQQREHNSHAGGRSFCREYGIKRHCHLVYCSVIVPGRLPSFLLVNPGDGLRCLRIRTIAQRSAGQALCPAAAEEDL